MSLAVGDRVEVKAVNGPLRLTGALVRSGIYLIFVSDQMGPGGKHPWRFLIDGEGEKVLWLNGNVDPSVVIRKLPGEVQS